MAKAKAVSGAVRQYANLSSKPGWAMSVNLFGYLWSLMSALMVAVYGRVGYLLYRSQITLNEVLPFVINAFLYFLNMSFAFDSKRLLMAVLIAYALWASILWCMYTIYPADRATAYLLVPVLLISTYCAFVQLFAFLGGSGRRRGRLF